MQRTRYTTWEWVRHNLLPTVANEARNAGVTPAGWDIHPQISAWVHVAHTDTGDMVTVLERFDTVHDAVSKLTGARTAFMLASGRG